MECLPPSYSNICWSLLLPSKFKYEVRRGNISKLIKILQCLFSSTDNPITDRLCAFSELPVKQNDFRCWSACGLAC